MENYKTLNLRKTASIPKKEEIKNYFLNTYGVEEELYKTLKRDESFYLRADPLRHPIIFYYGHTSAFYMNKLILAGLIKERINPKIESMCAIGVDEMSWDDLNEAHYDWPSVSEITQFRLQVKDLVSSLIDTLPLELPIEWDSPWWPIIMGIEHMRIHIETSSVLIRQLPISEVTPNPIFPTCKDYTQAPKNEIINVLGDIVTIGKERDDEFYGWDNEYGIHQAEVANMKVSKFLVSNREFLSFVEADGYSHQEYWTDEGWGWVTYTQAKFPRFWSFKEGEWYQRNLTEIIEMPWSWPVEVNYLEAKAFCNWKSNIEGKPYRLPTEDEWYQMFKICEVPSFQHAEVTPANINLNYWASSCPVNKFRFGSLYDIIGNVWQWTEVPIYPFKGFKVHPLYDDFTTPTYDGQHNLIKGGSWMSSGNLAIPESRYAFRRHFYQHAGFRYIQSDEPVKTYNTIYEEDPIVVEECERSWGEEKFGIKNLSTQLIEKALPNLKNLNKAMVIGCGAGRTVFELAKKFDFVEGIDFSARTFKLAVEMQQKGHNHYITVDEGNNTQYNEKYLSSFDLADTAEKVAFYQGDASNLLEKYSNYDLIISEVMLHKAYDPRKFLEMIHTRLTKNGLLLLAHTADWSEEHSTQDKWLGGIRGDDGEIVDSRTTIERILENKFNKIGDSDEIPYLIYKNRHRMLLKVACVTLWQIR
ncbi:5-histidylcysteine sulfoxide synthase [bacterium]|nr:5-histidylcysteine sulfoxide synthase [bacterium]